MTLRPPAPARGRGSAVRRPRTTRRRGEELEAAIREAALDLLVQQGVEGVTMEAVADRAGTSKPVLYRRWSDRGALLRDCLVPLTQSAIPAEDTGSYRGDMLVVLEAWREFFTGRNGVVAAAIVGAMPHDPELAQAFRDGVIGWRKQAMTDLLERGIARGEVHPDVRIDVARELGQAFLWHRFLVTGDPITSELVEHVVDAVLVPYVKAGPLATGAASGQGRRGRRGARRTRTTG